MDTQADRPQPVFNALSKIRLFFLFCVFIGSAFSISVTGVASLGLFAVTLILIAVSKEKIPNVIFHYGFALMLITGLIAAMVSPDAAANAAALRKYWRFIIPVCVMLALMQHNRLNLWLNATLAVACVMAVFGILQFFTGNTLIESGTYPYQSFETNQRWHAIGTFSHHMTYSGVMLLLFPVYVSGLYMPSISRTQRLCYLVGITLLVAAIVFSLSRSAWLGSLIALVIVLFLNKRKIELFFTLLLIAALAATVLYFSVDAASSQNNAAASANDAFSSAGKVATSENNALVSRFSEILSSPDRIKMIEAGIMVLKDHLWFGIGPKTIAPLEEAYRVIGETRGEIFNAAHVGVHNIYLQLILNYGIFHLIAFLLLWVSVFIAALSATARKSAAEVKETVFMKGIVAAFAGSLFMGLFENNFMDGEVQHLIMVWLGVIGYIVFRVRNYRKDRL